MASTIKDIAHETGLSIATVSKYINGGHLREKNRIGIKDAIRRLDYQVNEYARGLKSNRSKTIGIIIPELCNLFVTQIITVMEAHLRSKGYSIIVCDCHTDETIECEVVQFLLGKMVDGIVNMPVCRDGRHLQPVVEKGIPIVLIDRIIPSLSDYADCVLIDNKTAAHTATLHLLQNKHRHIGIITGPLNIYTSGQRLEGYRQALESCGATYESRFVSHSDYTVQGGYVSMSRLLSQNPDMTAVFVTNYEMTLGAIIAANEANVNIPDQLSFIGFDNIDLSRVTHPRLSIVTQPLNEIGTQAARLLLQRLQENMSVSPASVILSTSLHENGSVRTLF